jgi:DNA polymerase III delta prime subunit
MSNFSINPENTVNVDDAAHQLMQASMLNHAFDLLKKNEQELVTEFMPFTKLSYEDTLEEVRKGIRKDAYGFVYRLESKAFLKVLEAREARKAIAAT